MDELLTLGTLVKFKKGQLIAGPDDPQTAFFILSEGLVKSYVREKTGEQNIQLIYRAGEIFPLPWIVTRRPLDLIFEALTDIQAIKLDMNDALEILQSNASITFRFLQQVVRQFLIYKVRVDNLEYRFARERVAYRLLFLAKRFGKIEGNVIVLPRFNQEEIGAATNVSREGVSRELKRFERLGYINYLPGRIQITNIEGLRKELASTNGNIFFDDI